MHAVILSIGDELVLGQTVDTNSAFLSAELAGLGIGTRYHQTIGDDQASTTQAICQASAAAPLVLISGGLGPTDDDLTRQALADALGVDLVFHKPSLDAIKARMTSFGRKMPSRNEIQAMHPRGSQMIPNSCGTAPGIKAQLGRAIIYVAPGVPRELFIMFEKSILPELRRVEGTRDVILTTKINTFGMGESTVAEKLGGLTDRNRNPLVGTTVGDGIVAVRIRSEFADATQARLELLRTIEQVERRLGAVVFGRDEMLIQEALVDMLKQRRLTVATAESCTGGLMGKMITDVAGSSSVYKGGWLVYTNQMKIDHLGIDQALIEQHGAVSQPVVAAMARGAVLGSGADIGIAITGVAGPDGGTPGKPVGTVWIALAHPAEGVGAEGEASLLQLSGPRAMIRSRAATSALQMIRLHLMGQPVDEFNFARSPDKPAQ